MKGHGFQWSATPAVAWLGLAWVYASAAWLIVLFIQVSRSEAELAVAAGLRLALSLAVGIGLCALEPRAWATGVCLAGFYASCGAVVAAAAFFSVITAPPGSLSWTPLMLGIPRAACERLAGFSTAAFLLSAGVLALLWGGREGCEVPHRGTFTLLARSGLGPATLALVLDAYVGWNLLLQ